MERQTTKVQHLDGSLRARGSLMNADLPQYRQFSDDCIPYSRVRHVEFVRLLYLLTILRINFPKCTVYDTR